jgi:hypothetical protein
MCESIEGLLYTWPDLESEHHPRRGRHYPILFLR